MSEPAGKAANPGKASPASSPSFGTRVYRGLFRVFGPAQLGDPHEAPATAPPPAGACPRCGSSMEAHTYVQTAGRKRMRCPEDAGAAPDTLPGQFGLAGPHAGR